MASPSNIEWTGHTWNPVAGCTVLTPGCTNCYAMKMAARLAAMGQELYAGLTKPSKAGAVWTGVLREAPEHVLLAPLRRKKPTTYFVNSMSDLFHEGVSDAAIDKVFSVMRDCPQHTFQVLTKRAERMCAYVTDRFNYEADRAADNQILAPWPVPLLPNVWLGVSCERQQEADERIPHLLSTPAAIRFVSAEPLLGPIDFMMLGKGGDKVIDALQGCVGTSIGDGEYDGAQPCASLDWIIVGGESGHNARPFAVHWADSIVEQCKAAGVACFVKQLGAMPLSDGYPLELKSKKGGDWDEWPDRLRVREFPNAA